MAKKRVGPPVAERVAGGPLPLTHVHRQIDTHPALVAQLPMFLANRRQDVVAMLEALARAEFTTVERLGHSMRGSGASFGFQAISDLGGALEAEARRADIDATRRSVTALSLYLDGLSPLPAAVAVVQLARHLAQHSRKIVIVDDDDDVRLMFRQLLERRGHRVTDASNGIDGLELILAEGPDVAIVDVNLPGLDGHAVARRVREVLGQAVHLLALTGYSGAADPPNALAAGFDAHLTKPVNLELLDRMLESGPRAKA